MEIDPEENEYRHFFEYSQKVLTIS